MRIKTDTRVQEEEVVVIIIIHRDLLFNIHPKFTRLASETILNLNNSSNMVVMDKELLREVGFDLLRANDNYPVYRFGT